MDLTPKQQTSEAIRQAENILITTGAHPSVDQVAAVIALGMILRKFGKKVSCVISDSLPSSTSLLDTTGIEQGAGGMRDFILKVDSTKAQVDKLRYEMIDNKLNIFITPYQGSFAPSDVTFDYGKAQMQFDIAIILGVPTRARIDKVYEQNQGLFDQIPVINIDFHRSNENYGAVNLIEPTASSLCEMLVALSESLQGGSIDEPIATALLMGIIGSTDRFAAAHTTSKSLTVAAQMMAAGAKQQQVIRALYRDGKSTGGGNESRGDHNREQRSDGRQSDRRQSQPQQQSQTQVEPRRPRQQEPQLEPTQQESRRPESTPEARPAEPVFAPIVEDDGFPQIIQPSHIEMSEPEPTAFEPQEVPAMPEMADFAAAAEILAKRQEDDLTDTEV
jgi:nanoRNase/pAp phosphatase (c-di-AMP/oligoRNAs hydrolase)